MTHELNHDVRDALTRLLEAERASVEIAVALAASATDFHERLAFTTMGAEDIDLCCALRERLERADEVVSPYVSKVALTVLDVERYDDRLRAYATHQRDLGQQAESLLGYVEDERELRHALTGIIEAHTRHAIWTEQRADEFAASRLLEFKGAGLGWVTMTPNTALARAPATPRALMLVRDEKPDEKPDEKAHVSGAMDGARPSAAPSENESNHKGEPEA